MYRTQMWKFNRLAPFREICLFECWGWSRVLKIHNWDWLIETIDMKCKEVKQDSLIRKSAPFVLLVRIPFIVLDGGLPFMDIIRPIQLGRENKIH